MEQKTFNKIFAAIMLLSIVLIFFDLSFKIYNWDEAVHAWITRSFMESGEYIYSPVYHGPMQYYFTSIIFDIFGFNEFAGRLLPALAGVLVIATLYPLRKFIGEKATLMSAFMITISPTFLYYSRFFRNDIYIMLFSLVIFTSGLLYTKTKSVKYVILGAIALGLSVTAKENAIITGFIFFSFVALYFLKEVYRRQEKFTNLIKYAKKYASHLEIFILLSSFVAVALYTNLYTNLGELSNSISTGINYWLGQHEGGKFAAPFYFYFGRLFLYELPILIFGSLGILYYLKRGNTTKLFLIYWTITSFIIYSFLQEKMPQLLLNIILPMSILASIYISEKIFVKNFRKNMNYLLTGVLTITLLLTIFAGTRAVYINPTDSSEPLMYAQTEHQIREFISIIDAVASENNGYDTTLQILRRNGEGLSSPVFWYLWDYKNKDYIEDNTTKVSSPIVISLIWNDDEIDKEMIAKGYTKQRFYTWGYINHDKDFSNYFNPNFYFFREAGEVSEQGIINLYTK